MASIMLWRSQAGTDPNNRAAQIALGTYEEIGFELMTIHLQSNHS